MGTKKQLKVMEYEVERLKGIIGELREENRELGKSGAPGDLWFIQRNRKLERDVAKLKEELEEASREKATAERVARAEICERKNAQAECKELGEKLMAATLDRDKWRRAAKARFNNARNLRDELTKAMRELCNE